MAVVIPLLPAGAHAQGPAPQGRLVTACRTEPAGTGTVRAVVDGRSIMLDDGRDIRLAGIEVPFPPPAAETSARAEAARAASIAAKAALEAILGGQEVEVRRTGDGPDRYGRLPAQVLVGRDGARRSAAHEMLGRGFARVAARIGGEAPDRACATELFALERAARETKLGLWGGSYYAVMPADGPAAELAAERGRFTVVEGKVLSVRESAGTIYMNFGRQWSQALTVTILKRNERSFAAAGLEPRTLENRRLRVRGWLEDRNGPRIEATRPEQIEIAERN
jgi:endonuclease YncB( thermonuclease family)